MNLAIALRGALVMILVGSGLGLAHNALSPDPVPWKPVPKTALSLDDLVPDDPGAAEREAAGEPVDGALERERVAADEAPPPARSEVDPVPADDGASAAAEQADLDGSVAAEPEGETAAPVDPAASAPARADADYSDIPESEFPLQVSLARAKALYDRGGLLVLDARELEDYAAGHIASAQCAPYDEMVGDLEWLERTAADPRPVLVYCDGTDCELSLNLGFEISQGGHRKVLVLQDGFSSWSDAGYPTATGERP